MLDDAHCQIFIAPDCTAAQAVHLIGHTLGFASYVVLWVTVLWGMVLGRGWGSTRFKHSTLYSIHMTVALIGITLGWSHAVGQLFVPGGPTFFIDLFIPLANARDPIGIGVGVISIEIMTALMISVPLQRKMGYGRWRAMHSLAYGAFTLLAGHILLSGRHVGPYWFIKYPVIAMWLSTIVLWLGVSKWALNRKRAVTDAAGNRLRSQTAEVSVDAGKCARFGFCEQEAPTVFELRSDGRLGYKSTVAPADVAAVSRAVKVCPARAISLNRAGTRVYMPQKRAEEPAEERQKDGTPARRDRASRSRR